MSFIRRIPIPMSALALGTAGLGNLLSSYSPAIRTVCTAVAALIALLVIARLVLDFRNAWAELKNPAILSVLPALFMALMLVAAYLRPITPAPALALWLGALTLQLLTVGLFIVRYVVSFDLAKVLPSWFLVFVGFVVGTVTSPAFGMVGVGRVLLYAGLAGLAVTFPVVVYRLAKGAPLPTPLAPTIAILAAPSSLCLAGYLTVATTKQVIVVQVLLALTTVTLLYVIANLPRIVRLGFLPSVGALTFPVVISAIAVKMSAAFLAASGSGITVPGIAVQAMGAFAAAMVLYALGHYVVFLAVPAKA